MGLDGISRIDCGLDGAINQLPCRASVLLSKQNTADNQHRIANIEKNTAYI